MYKKLLATIFLVLFAVGFLFACKSGETTEKSDTVTEGAFVFAPYSYERNEYKLVKVLEKKDEVVIPSVVNGKTIVSIGHSAFQNHTELKSVVIPETVRVIDDYAFDNCSSLEKIVIPQNVTEIGYNAFARCTKLKEIAFPKSLEIIESCAFSGCEALEKIYVNPSLKIIGRDAFGECPSISEIHVSDISAWCKINFENISANPLVDAERLYVSGELAENLIIRNVETVSPYAFFSFDGIKTLTLGEGVVNVKESAFSNCKSLKSLTLSDSVKNIGTSAFNSCTSLEYVSVGGGVEYFAGLAFYDCKAIKILDIKNLFSWCYAFFYTDSTGSANPMIYAERLFVNGSEVEDLVIPTGVEKISTLAFIGYRGKKVIIPSTVKFIEDTVFYMCDNIEELHFNGTYDELMLVSIGANNFGKEIKISYNR